MPTLRLARALLIATCLLLALPAVSSAATYTVDSIGDQADDDPGDGECKTTFDTCTLRAAIEESNFSVAAADSIAFDANEFKGEEIDMIQPGTTLPAILSPLSIDGGSCTTAGIAGGPCAGIQGLAGDPVLAVEADDSSIEGLAITAGSIGIGVFGASTGFTAAGNWIGIGLNGVNGGSASAGIFLDPGSDQATIGGSAVADRNVISFSGVGLDIEGASGAVVRGNWFGMQADGTHLGPAGANIEITNLKPLVGEELKAEDNEIGATIAGAALSSAGCDGGCNVISSATGRGIDLAGNIGQGETPASGPTTIHGNYVGLNPAGTETVDNVSYEGNAQYGILAGGADDVLVGGAEPGDANFIGGGEYGVYGENGDDLLVAGDTIGSAPGGSPIAPPAEVGIFAFAEVLDDPLAGAEISDNSVRMGEDGIGIEHRFIGAQIVGNTLEGGASGILTKGAADGSFVEGNLVEGSEDSGIVLQNPDNEVLGNEVLGAGQAGIEINPTATIDVSGNRIGGDSAEAENAVFDSGDAAIQIFGVEDSRNEVGRNHGSGNGIDFITLRPFNGPEGDPNGLKWPKITAAAKVEASGTAEPGALVRVFRKASVEPGELAGFLGEATADGSGQWKAAYPAQPEGTMVTATQTLGGGTSGLGEAATTPPDPPAPTPTPTPTSPAPSAQAPLLSPPSDSTPPKARITKAPQAKSTSTTAKFKFNSDETGSSFKCKLDKKAFAGCKSPKAYKKLKPGKHVFKVKAVDPAGNVSAVVSRKFTVLG